MRPWRALVDRVSSGFAFFPPSPSYQLIASQVHNGRFQLASLDEPCIVEHNVFTVRTKPTPKGKHGEANSIIVVSIPYKRVGMPPADYTLLCSHGNAVDLGHLLTVYRELSRILRVNVVGYDYSGYGRSTGTPTASQTLSDIQAVYDWLVEDRGVSPSRILLYGQSVGSGPTTWLAAHQKDVGGVILQSPLLSGMRVLRPDLKWWPVWADVYPNHKLAPKITAPVLVMHGTEDEVIHISCGRKLAGLLKDQFPPFWAEGYNHQNVEASPDFIPTLQRFLTHVKQQQQQQGSFTETETSSDFGKSPYTTPPSSDMIAVPEFARPGIRQ